MKFNEDSRVKLPAILHLTQLGYEYISLKTAKWDIDTNIFTDIFLEYVGRINPSLSKADKFSPQETQLMIDLILELN